MKILFLKYIAYILITMAFIFGVSSCAGGISAANKTWSLIELVNVGDPIENLISEVVEVKNCGIPIEKTTDCSAGTSNDLSVTLNGEITPGSQFAIGGSVGTTLGIGQQSGESVKLSTPPDGLIYIYTVNKVYRTVTGEVLARSSDGNEQIDNFSFHASCSIDVAAREQVSCSGAAPVTDDPSSPPPTDIPVTESPVPPPSSADTPPGTILEIGDSWRQEGLELQLVEKEFYCVECGWLTLSFKLTNVGSQERIVNYSLENFTAVDDMGRSITVGAIGNWTFTQDCPKNTVVVPSQDVVYLSAGTCQLPDNFTWSIGETMAMELNLSDQYLQEIIVSVSGISSINGAQWRIPINH